VNDPSERQHVGALLVAEFLIRVNGFLTPKG
jgi:hypothetical protein